MSVIQYVDQESILNWLENLDFKHYMCGQCQGAHISDVQLKDGVIESRLFVEQDCIIYTTELDIRHSALFSVSAELHNLNATYANLKLFLDISDNCPSRLIICDTVWISAGLSREQFNVFLRAAINAKLEIIEILTNCQFLETHSGEDERQITDFLH